MRVVIIGCGLAGVTTAWFLRQRGVDVVVVEREPAPARQTSYANGSMITPSLADPWNAPGAFSTLLGSLGKEDSAMLLRPASLPSLLVWGLQFLRNSSEPRFLASFLANVRLALYSQQVMQTLLQGLAGAHALNFDYSPDGIVKVYSDQASLRRGLEVASWLRQAGIEHHALDHDALMSLEPALIPGGDRLAGGIHYPQDEVGDARLFCEQLHQRATDAGVDFRFSELVLGVEHKRKRIVSIRTSREQLRADVFVLAAGSSSWPLGKTFGVKVPVRPAKGYSITVPTMTEAPLPHYAIVDEALHAAVVPLGRDRLRVAGTAEFAGFDRNLNPARVANLTALLGRIYPQLEPAQAAADAWCGLRPMTADGRPLLGATRVSNLFLNTGHGPLGWTLACGSGQLLADLITGEQTDIDPAPFAASRFQLRR